MAKGKHDLRVNDRIRVPKVRLIDQDNNQVGIVGKNEAINMSRAVGLDLVEVAPTSEPPVCRIMDYGKYLYQQKRKMRDSHKKSQTSSTTMKEIRLRPETDAHDLEIKVKHGRQFAEKGHKVQFTIMFRGRQMLHQEQGYKILEEIRSSLEDITKVERPARMSNRRMTMMLVPNK